MVGRRRYPELSRRLFGLHQNPDGVKVEVNIALECSSLYISALHLRVTLNFYK